MKPRLRERAARRLKFWAERIEAGAVPGKIIEFEPVDHAKGTKAFNHYRKLEMEISRVHGSEAKIEALKAELDRAREDFLEATTRREVMHVSPITAREARELSSKPLMEWPAEARKFMRMNPFGYRLLRLAARLRKVSEKIQGKK